MKILTRSDLLVCLLIAAVLIPTSCQSVDRDLDNARRTVLQYFDDTANYPFEAHPSLKDIMHPDFVSPGVEGTKISIIAKPVVILSAQRTTGDYDIVNPHQEDVIEVVARLKQVFYLVDSQARKEDREYDVHLILSKGTQAKYRILWISDVGVNFAFEDAVRSDLQKSSDKESIELRKSLTRAGMRGLGE